jgi:hypothetical protein
MSKSAKHRAATTHSGRARNDETTRPKQTDDAERGMAARGDGARGKRPSPPSAQAQPDGPDPFKRDAYEQRKESS